MYLLGEMLQRAEDYKTRSNVRYAARLLRILGAKCMGKNFRGTKKLVT